MMTQAGFYQIHLDRVSRSFAFCIQQLNSPLKEWVGLSYLLCRVLDTIEDSPWSEQAEQFKAFELFDQALLDETKTMKLETWTALFPREVNSSERMLLEDAAEIVEDLHRLPPEVQKQVRELVHSMSMGMQHFAKQNKTGTLRLQTLEEVNQYCFFVAGLVGELLTQLLAHVESGFRLDQASIAKAHHFGLFLQKVNLLKDQAQDQNLGRNLIPSRDQVEASARENALYAFEFLAQVPVSQAEFRRFCGWSLFLGLEALKVSREAPGRVVKVPRSRAEEIVLSVEDSLSEPSKLRGLFDSAFRAMNWETSKPDSQPPAVIPEWLYGIYQGHLSRETIAQVLN